METYVALLFSIVLGDGRRLVMSDLRAMATGIGLRDARTLVATGNLVFEAQATSPPELEERLEAAFEVAFGRRLDIIVRKAEDWRGMVDANPFPEQSRADPAHVVVRVMRAPLAEGAAEALEPYRTDGEIVLARGGDLWIYFGNGVGRSKLAAVLTPKRHGIGTMRNWNTVRKVCDMVGA